MFLQSGLHLLFAQFYFLSFYKTVIMLCQYAVHYSDTWLSSVLGVNVVLGRMIPSGHLRPLEEFDFISFQPFSS